MKIVYDKNESKIDTSKKIYECSICESLFNWGGGSSRFGSYKIAEECPDKLKYFCSKSCESKFVKSKKL